MVDEASSSPKPGRWLTPLATAWLFLALPCWWLSAMVFINWADGPSTPSMCGTYPCDILLVLAMVYAVIPVSAIVALVVVVRALWRTLPEVPGP